MSYNGVLLFYPHALIQPAPDLEGFVSHELHLTCQVLGLSATCIPGKNCQQVFGTRLQNVKWVTAELSPRNEFFFSNLLLKLLWICTVSLHLSCYIENFVDVMFSVLFILLNSCLIYDMRIVELILFGEWLSVFVPVRGLESECDKGGIPVQYVPTILCSSRY